MLFLIKWQKNCATNKVATDEITFNILKKALSKDRAFIFV